ncbi:MAG: type VI secretion system baseplate subunit TssG [Gemmobacter sp.]
METGHGSRPDHLTHYAQLLDSPQTHHIFMALRIIEAQFADRPRLGESKRPREDAVRLTQEAELAFPTSTIESFQPPSGASPGKLATRFFGLWGPMGPLPLHLTEFARDRLRNHKDNTLIAFTDMFTHRLMSLFYRAWAASHPAPSFDRSLKGTRTRGEADPFERKVAALSGHYENALRDRDAMPDLAKRHFVGHLTPAPRHAEGLVSIVSVFVRTQVRLRQFVGEWLQLEPDDRWELGTRVGLGMGTSIGARVWSHAAKFRLRIGPMSLADYSRLMPGSATLDRLEDIVRNYVGDTLDWDINLVLAGGEVPQAQLGGSTTLGHTSWIGTAGRVRDTDDLYLVPKSLARQRAAAA